MRPCGLVVVDRGRQSSILLLWRPPSPASRGRLPLPDGNHQVRVSDPLVEGRFWRAYVCLHDEPSVRDAVKRLRRVDRKCVIRVMGDYDEMFKTGLRRGFLGYLFVHSPAGDYSRFDSDDGEVLDGSLTEEEVCAKSWTIDQVEAANLLGRAVDITGGRFKRLRGVVVAEGTEDVDVLIQMMTLERIVSVPRRFARPVVAGQGDGEV